MKFQPDANKVLSMDLGNIEFEKMKIIEFLYLTENKKLDIKLRLSRFVVIKYFRNLTEWLINGCFILRNKRNWN